MSNMQSFVRTFENEFLLRIVLAIGLLFACSQITIPLHPVPITLQTIGVVLIGLTYKPSEAFLSHAIFLGMGAVGLPMFAGFTGGLPILLGTTGGYLVGFMVAATVMAYLNQTLFVKHNWVTAMLNSMVGLAVIFAMGVAWLSSLIGFENAIKFGLIPFILPGILKNVVLVSLLSTMKPLWLRTSQDDDQA